MIPNSELPNSLEGSKKHQLAKDVYTPVYTSEFQLEDIINSWERLPQELKNVILKLVMDFPRNSGRCVKVMRPAQTVRG